MCPLSEETAGERPAKLATDVSIALRGMGVAPRTPVGESSAQQPQVKVQETVAIVPPPRRERRIQVSSAAGAKVSVEQPAGVPVAALSLLASQAMSSGARKPAGQKAGMERRVSAVVPAAHVVTVALFGSGVPAGNVWRRKTSPLAAAADGP